MGKILEKCRFFLPPPENRKKLPKNWKNGPKWVNIGLEGKCALR